MSCFRLRTSCRVARRCHRYSCPKSLERTAKTVRTPWLVRPPCILRTSRGRRCHAQLRDLVRNRVLQADKGRALLGAEWLYAAWPVRRCLCSECDAPLHYAGVAAPKDSYGKQAYLSECEELHVTPAAQIVKYLEADALVLSHYGIGDKGLQALLAALQVCTVQSKCAYAACSASGASLCAGLGSKPGRHAPGCTWLMVAQHVQCGHDLRGI